MRHLCETLRDGPTASVRPLEAILIIPGYGFRSVLAATSEAAAALIVHASQQEPGRQAGTGGPPSHLKRVAAPPNAGPSCKSSPAIPSSGWSQTFGLPLCSVRARSRTQHGTAGALRLIRMIRIRRKADRRKRQEVVGTGGRRAEDLPAGTVCRTCGSLDLQATPAKMGTTSFTCNTCGDTWIVRAARQ
jgi:hypothetical protein